MIVITGAQRSGTSFMAKLFKAHGFYLGDVYWDERINGGYENPDICNFFRDFTGDINFPFSEYWKHYKLDKFNSFSTLNTPVVKFSYLLMCPEFVKQWYISRGNQDTFIIMKRKISDIIKSKNSRKEFKNEDSELLNISEVNLKSNFEHSFHFINSYKIPFIIIDFPITNIQNTIKKIKSVTDVQLNSEIFHKLYIPELITMK